MSMNNKEEPSTAPNPDRWYTLTLGSSFKDTQPPSSKFCTLRYEFKPASIDKTQPGSLHKTKDNKISVEFKNNQPGKPKVTFEGSSEDYKENDAVLFFDGQGFRLERLHRAVKRLRHVRLPGEAASAAALAGGSGAGAGAGAGVGEAGSPPLGRGGGVKGQPPRPTTTFTPPPPPPPPVPHSLNVEVERIDIGGAASSGGKPKNEKPTSTPPPQPVATASPESDDSDLVAQLDIMNDDEEELGPVKTNSGENLLHTGIDINLPHQDDMDDEIADVDVGDDSGGMGRNAAEALRAQVNAEEREEQTSSSSASSESESSESSSDSGSGSSSDGESSGDDSVHSI